MSTIDQISSTFLLATATDAAQRAAEQINAATSRRAIATKSSDTDIVTETDLASEEAIKAVLAAATPGARMLGEESGPVRLGDGEWGAIEWIVDPLDGTVNFFYGVPIVAVSIAAAIDGRSVAGLVMDATGAHTFTAAVGEGALLNGKPIGVSGCSDIGAAMIGTGYAYDPERRRRHAQRVADLIGQVRDFRTYGSAALQLCGVACGWLDAYAERHIKPWDWAAGMLICEEAGATVEYPCPENDDLVMATTPAVFTPIRSHF